MARTIRSTNSLNKIFVGNEMQEFLTNFLLGKVKGLVTEVKKEIVVNWIKPELDKLHVNPTTWLYAYNSSCNLDEYLLELGNLRGTSIGVKGRKNKGELGYNIETVAKLRIHMHKPVTYVADRINIFENYEEASIAYHIIKGINSNFNLTSISYDSGNDDNEHIYVGEGYFTPAKSATSLERRVNKVLQAKNLLENYFKKLDEATIARAKEKAKRYLSDNR